ncbi:MAG: hypothetical protein IJX25_03980 [Clostridia bacterium]|nr:hypothetical protein [Clostridia bacterium]
MAKTKTTKSILKTVAAGFACMMCTAFFPATAIANALEDYSKDAGTLVNVNSISVDTGSKTNEQQSLTVKKGDLVTIPTATYSYKTNAGGQGSHTIGEVTEADTAEGISSEIIVTEKASQNVVDASSGSFRATNVGTYVITYKVTHGQNEYTYDMEVTSQATEASFDFETNVEDVIPNVYDISIADNKNVVLPLPTVMGEDEKTLLANDDINNFVRQTETATGDVYVKISLTNGGEGLTIEKGDEGYYISGEALSAYDEENKTYNYDGKTIKVVYSFYQKVDGNPVYVASTSKSFTVKANYYYTDSTKKESGYELEATFASTFPDSATVGVEKTLPSVVGTTKSANSPASEGVEVYYTIKVIKADANGKYNTEDAEDVTDKVLTDGNKFTAKEEGSYKFIYTVKDFYGHTADSDTVTKIIENVKDSKSASVFMYDAINPGYDKTAKTYESAENSLKTKSVNRNIIMYAIGGTDNMVENENITLRREIRNYSGVKQYVIEEKAYNAYNLIFAPTLSNAEDYDTLEKKENALYAQIVDDNFALRSQLELADVNTDDGSAVKGYLKGKYLIVTTEFNKDAFGNTIDDSITGEDDETAIEKMMAKGYAYIAPQSSATGKFNNQSYTFYYFASDNINKESSIKKDIEFVEDYLDYDAPTLTFSSDLQASYLATDKFTFNVASVTDTANQDSRLSAITAYRFLNDSKEKIVSDDTTELKYYAERVSDAVAKSDKWYNQAGVVVKEAGWYVDENATEYTVDLSKKPNGAAYVEIFAYAIDDNGNVGFFNKIVSIADASDLEMPTLQSVKKAPTGSDAFYAPDEIALPSLSYTDNKANYMTAKVSVNKIVRDEAGKITKIPVTSYGMNAKHNPYLGTYTISGGYFRASVGGEYQVAITAVDAANHSITSYFTYKVNDSVSSELVPTIDNISSAEETLKPGKTLYLTPPSISINKESKYGYIGLEEDDDTNTATWYNVEAISASDNDYKILNNLYFSAGTEGTYKLKYTAYLIRYDVSKLKETPSAEGDLTLNEQGQLFYFDGSNSHLVYLNEENGYALTAVGYEGTSLPQSLTDNVTSYVAPSDAVITVTVSSASLSINDDEMNLHYSGKTEYNLGDKIEIIKPIVTSDGTTAVDAENTTVTITRNSTTLATIKLSEWQHTEDINLKDYFDVTSVDGKISLIFVKDGKYTISYDVDATVGAGDEYSVTLSAGDVTAPELEIGNEIVEENYQVGDTLHIAFSNTTIDDSILKMSDEVTTKVADLLEKMTVKIKYEDNSYETLDNEAEEDGYYDYSYELTQKGTYTLSITITDEAGNSVTKTKEFEVGAEEGSSVNATEVMGGVLIGLSVALLAGVVIYFVVSKKKLDKKEKSYRNEKSKSRKK